MSERPWYFYSPSQYREYALRGKRDVEANMLVEMVLSLSWWDYVFHTRKFRDVERMARNVCEVSNQLHYMEYERTKEDRGGVPRSPLSHTH